MFNKVKGVGVTRWTDLIRPQIHSTVRVSRSGVASCIIHESIDLRTLNPSTNFEWVPTQRDSRSDPHIPFPNRELYPDPDSPVHPGFVQVVHSRLRTFLSLERGRDSPKDATFYLCFWSWKKTRHLRVPFEERPDGPYSPYYPSDPLNRRGLG